MLARANRITSGDDYRRVSRTGIKRPGQLFVVSVKTHETAGHPSRFGFIISKKVAGAVGRNTIRRRMKAFCRTEVLPRHPTGLDVVFRALPTACAADYHALVADAVRCLQRAGVDLPQLSIENHGVSRETGQTGVDA